MKDAAAQQGFGGVAGDDALGQAFDDGRFAHARFADEGRVVLGAAGQDLDDALDFALAANDRVELVVFGQGGEVGGKLIHQRRFALGFFLFIGQAAGRLLLRGRGSGRGRLLRVFLQNAPGLAADLFRRDAKLVQHVNGNTFVVAHQPQQNVLGADVVLVHAFGFVNGQFQGAPGSGGQINFAGLGALGGAAEAIYHFLHSPLFKPKFTQYPPGYAAFFAHQAKQ